MQKKLMLIHIYEERKGEQNESSRDRGCWL